MTLLAGGALAGTAGAAVVAYRLQIHDRRQSAYRATGMAAFDRGDYRAACEPLRKYLGNDRVDADAVFALAVSRSNSPSPDQSQLLDAKRLFNRYLELRPGDADARHRLLDVYRRLNDPYDAGATADAILATFPDDVPAWIARRQVRVAAGDYAGALAAARKVTALRPDDVAGHEVVVELMSRQSRPSAEITGYADQLLTAHADDPRFELLRAVACFYTGDTDGTRKWLRQAAGRHSPSADFTVLLAKTFDQIGMYEDARQVIEHADPAVNSPALTAYATRRLFQSGRYDAAMARLGSTDPDDSDLLGLKGLLSIQLRRPVDDLIGKLAARSDDIAASWSTLLTAMASPPPPGKLAAAYLSAAVQNPDGPEARYYLGRANLARGEADRAVDNFRQAQQLAPAWWEPFTAEAEALLGQNRVADAAGPAYAGYDRAPSSPVAQAIELIAAFRRLPPNASVDRVRQLAELAMHAHTDQPDDGRVAATYVALLVKVGRTTDAQAVARECLRRSDAAPGLLYPVASAAVAGQLSLNDDISRSCDAVKPTTPQQAYEQGATLALIGRTQAAVTAIDANASRGPAWAVASLQLHDAVRKPLPAGRWAEVAATAANDLDVQQAVIGSPSARADRALIDKCIDRIRSIAGDESVGWRLARARSQMDSADESRQDLNAVAASMATVVREVPHSIEGMRLWAEAIERLGDLPGSLAVLERAGRLSPTDPAVALRAAALMVRTGRPRDAVETVDRVVTAGVLLPQAELVAANLYMAGGATDKALDLLRNAPADTDHSLALAVIADDRGDPSAGAALDHLLDTDPTRDVVRATARHYARNGDVDRGRQCLDKLDESADPVGTELTIAEFESAFGTPTAADAAFSAAAKMGGSDARLAWAASRLRRRDFAGAAAVAVGPSTRLNAMADAARRLAAVPWSTELTPLVDALASDPTDSAAVDTLSSLGSIDGLTKVAAKYPGAWPVRAILVDRAMTDGRYDDAITAARAAADASPADPSPARALATVYAAGNRWDDCLSAASEHKSRGGGVDADLLIATADLHLRRPGDAAAVVKPHLKPSVSAVQTSLERNDEQAEVVDLYCRATAAEGMAGITRTTLSPLATRSAAWRRRWCGVVRDQYTDAAVVAADLQAVRSMIPDGAADERLTLAGAFHGAGVRLGDGRLLKSAAGVLEPLTDSPHVPADAHQMLGVIRQSQNDLAGAEESYRAALSADPSSPTTMNNLADLILRRGGDVAEARRLATEAVRRLPASSAAHGTLAKADAAAGDTATAGVEFEKAIRLDADAIEPRLGWAQWLVGRGNKADAGRLLRDVRKIIEVAPERRTADIDDQVNRLNDAVRRL